MAIFDLFRRWVRAAPTPDDRRQEPRVRSAVGTRVLVVDDSATIRAVLRKMLLQDGYGVLQAATGEDGIAIARDQQPGLIFLDVVLPGISGFAALRALRHGATTRTVPIVMMSGNQQATERFYVERIGADGFIRKPFGRGDVFHAIQTLVESGRLPERVAPPPVDPIPDGMSAAEWDAIPDVALPDPPHAGGALHQDPPADGAAGAASVDALAAASGDGASVGVRPPE